MALLRTHKLSRSFNLRSGIIHAVQDVTLEVHTGECLAIVGESGSGKTTLANIILGILAPSSGSIEFNGSVLPTKRSAQHRRNIQLVQQNPLSSLNPKRSIGASVRLGLDTYDIGKKSDRWQKVEEALVSVGLEPEMRNRSPATLSGGQRQRVGIARALICNPRLVVLDEPTSALDVMVQARILRLLNQLRTERGFTYMFITHDLAVVRNVADRVAVFQSGKLIETGTTDQLFANPQSNYTRQLISAVPVVSDEELALRNQLAEQL